MIIITYMSNKLLYGIGNKAPIGIVQKLQVILWLKGHMWYCRGTEGHPA